MHQPWQYHRPSCEPLQCCGCQRLFGYDYHPGRAWRRGSDKWLIFKLNRGSPLEDVLATRRVERRHPWGIDCPWKGEQEQVDPEVRQLPERLPHAAA